MSETSNFTLDNKQKRRAQKIANKLYDQTMHWIKVFDYVNKLEKLANDTNNTGKVPPRFNKSEVDGKIGDFKAQSLRESNKDGPSISDLSKCIPSYTTSTSGKKTEFDIYSDKLKKYLSKKCIQMSIYDVLICQTILKKLWPTVRCGKVKMEKLYKKYSNDKREFALVGEEYNCVYDANRTFGNKSIKLSKLKSDIDDIFYGQDNSMATNTLDNLKREYAESCLISYNNLKKSTKKAEVYYNRVIKNFEFIVDVLPEPTSTENNQFNNEDKKGYSNVVEEAKKLQSNIQSNSTLKDFLGIKEIGKDLSESILKTKNTNESDNDVAGDAIVTYSELLRKYNTLVGSYTKIIDYILDAADSISGEFVKKKLEEAKDCNKKIGKRIGYLERLVTTYKSNTKNNDEQEVASKTIDDIMTKAKTISESVLPKVEIKLDKEGMKAGKIEGSLYEKIKGKIGEEDNDNIKLLICLKTYELICNNVEFSINSDITPLLKKYDLLILECKNNLARKTMNASDGTAWFYWNAGDHPGMELELPSALPAISGLVSSMLTIVGIASVVMQVVKALNLDKAIVKNFEKVKRKMSNTTADVEFHKLTSTVSHTASKLKESISSRTRTIKAKALSFSEKNKIRKGKKGKGKRNNLNI